jgi:hypothetical protein
MPFAATFRAMMDFPLVGDALGDFVVESVDVTDGPGGPGGLHTYQVRIALQGPGGKQGVQKALKGLFSSHPTTFSAYGNAYQLWFGKPEIERSGDKRYAVKVQGAGARLNLEHELHLLLSYLDETDRLAAQTDQEIGDELIEAYLERYRADIRRKVERYKRRLRRAQDGGK